MAADNRMAVQARFSMIRRLPWNNHFDCLNIHTITNFFPCSFVAIKVESRHWKTDHVSELGTISATPQLADLQYVPGADKLFLPL
jgi:hypothetical protein